MHYNSGIFDQLQKISDDFLEKSAILEYHIWKFRYPPKYQIQNTFQPYSALVRENEVWGCHWDVSSEMTRVQSINVILSVSTSWAAALAGNGLLLPLNSSTILSIKQCLKEYIMETMISQKFFQQFSIYVEDKISWDKIWLNCTQVTKKAMTKKCLRNSDLSTEWEWSNC